MHLPSPVMKTSLFLLKKGFEATADYDSYIYEVHSAKKPGGEIKWHTYTGGYNLQRPEFTSKNGKIIIYVEEGNARLRAAKVSSKDGIEIITPNGVLEKESVITSNNWYQHYKNHKLLDTHGTQKR